MNRKIKEPRVPIKNTIAARLLTRVFYFYFVVTITVTLLHMIADYRTTQSDTEVDLKVFQGSFQPGLAIALWNQEELGLESSLRAMLQVPQIVGAQVMDEEGNLVAAIGEVIDESGAQVVYQDETSKESKNAPGFSQLFWKKSDIHYADDSVYLVGSLVLYSSSAFVFTRVQDGYLFIIINSIIKTVALWVIFLLISRRLLHEPITKLTRSVITLDLEKDNIEKINIGSKGNNELSILESAFKSMASRLKDSRLQLKQANLLLEEKVRQRTDELEQKNNELQLANQSLEKISTTDPLTGLYNRRYLEEHLPLDIALTTRSYDNWLHDHTNDSLPPTTDLVFYFIDIDFFKRINDTYGHDAGDLVLIQLCQLMRAVFRKSDYMVRWGGEEFLIVTRFVEKNKALLVAERMRVVIEENPFDIKQGKTINCTCSIGFSSFPFDLERADNMAWNEIVQIADKALYAAKNSGRNCWVGLTHSDNVHQQISFHKLMEITDFELFEQVDVYSSKEIISKIVWK